jgi:tetratricopeptide (TPR) repeat protein
MLLKDQLDLQFKELCERLENTESKETDKNLREIVDMIKDEKKHDDAFDLLRNLKQHHFLLDYLILNGTLSIGVICLFIDYYFSLKRRDGIGSYFIGKLFCKIGKWKKAARQFLKSIKTADFPEAHYEYGLFFFQSQCSDFIKESTIEIATHFEKAAEGGVNEANLKLGNLLYSLQSDQKENKTELADKCIKAYKDYLNFIYSIPFSKVTINDIKYKIGSVYFKQGNYTQCFHYLNDLTTKIYLTWQIAYIYCYVHVDYEKALRHIQELFSCIENNSRKEFLTHLPSMIKEIDQKCADQEELKAKTFVACGKFMFNNRNYKEALVIFEKYGIYAEVAQCYIALHDHESAVKYLSLAMENKEYDGFFTSIIYYSGMRYSHSDISLDKAVDIVIEAFDSLPLTVTQPRFYEVVLDLIYEMIRVNVNEATSKRFFEFLTNLYGNNQDYYPHVVAFCLGLCHVNSIGVAFDYNEALKYLTIAKENNVVGADACLRNLNKLNKNHHLSEIQNIIDEYSHHMKSNDYLQACNHLKQLFLK